jgi:hypothetical protein
MPAHQKTELSPAIIAYLLAGLVLLTGGIVSRLVLIYKEKRKGHASFLPPCPARATELGSKMVASCSRSVPVAQDGRPCVGLAASGGPKPTCL